MRNLLLRGTPLSSYVKAYQFYGIIILIGILSCRLAAAEELPAGERLGASFHNGFFLDSADGAFHMRMGGLVQADTRYFPENAAPGPVDQFSLRSARLESDATLYRVVDARLNFDGGQGKFQVQEAWAELHPSPLVRLRVGKFKEPFGLERWQPEGRTAFMERGFPTQISPNRDTGVMLFGEIADGALQYFGGVFNGVVDNSTVDGELDNDKEEVLRVFLHPLRPSRIAALRDLGLGGAGSFAQLTGTVANPQLNALSTDGLTPFFKYVAGTTIETTAIAAGERWRATGQAYWYVGRFGFLGEYTRNTQEIRLKDKHDTVGMTALSVYATFLLTNDKAAFLGVKPEHPFSVDGARGWGAWEIGLRYSSLSVDDVAFKQGYADAAKSPNGAASYTLGLNWYLSANAKVQVNLERTSFSAFSAGTTVNAERAAESAVMARLQYSL